MADEPVYLVKRIEFFGRSVKVCLQNINGPCPLLAIANVLSLRNELKLPAGINQISQSQLVTMVADILLERNKHSEFAAEHAAYLQQNLADAFEVLQKLTTGIDVNVKFHNVFAFEPTKEVTVFDLLGIPLVHGWLVDPADAPLAAALGARSYNELVEVMLTGLDPGTAQQLRASSSIGGRSASGVPHGLLRPTSSLTAAAEAAAAGAAGATHAPATAAAAGGGGDMAGTGAALGSPQGNEAAAAAESLPVAISSSQGQVGTPESGGVDAAWEAAEAAEQSADAVIEDLLTSMVTTLTTATTPVGSIELGASPTRSESLTRRLAYEGAGASRFSSSSGLAPVGSGTVPLLAADEGLAPTAIAAAAAATGAGALPGTSQHQQQPPLGPVLSASPRAPTSGSEGGAQDASLGMASRMPSSTTHALLLQQWFDSTCSQLTPYGIVQLAAQLKEHQLAVLFRNNHFSTLFKYEEAIYALVTDQGYVHEPDIVWERLDSVAGDTSFFTGAFTPFVPHAPPAGGFANMDDATAYDAAIAASLAAEQEGHSGVPGAAAGAGAGAGAGGAAGHPPHALDEVEDADYRLALQLQMQEEEALRDRQAAIAAQEAAGQQRRTQGTQQQHQPHEQQYHMQQQQLQAQQQQQWQQQQQQQQQWQQQGGGLGRGRGRGAGVGGPHGGAGRGGPLGQVVDDVKEKCSIM